MMKKAIIGLRHYLNNADTKYWKISLFIITLIFLTYIQYFNYRTPKYMLKLNSVATKGIKAPIDFYVDDESSTLLKIEEAKLNSLVAFRMIPEILTQKERIISDDFINLRRVSNDVDLEDGEKTVQYQKILRSYRLTDSEVQELMETVSLKELEQFVLINLKRIMLEGVVEDRDWILDQIKKQRKIFKKDIILVRGAKEEKISINQVLTLEDAIENMDFRIENQYRDKPSARKFLLRIFEYILEPNLEVDLKVTSRIEDAEVSKVPPVKQLIRQGQNIIRDGDIVREEHLKKINALNEQVLGRNKMQVVIGFTLFNLILLILFSYFSFKIELIKFDLNRLILISTSLYLTVLISLLLIPKETVKEGVWFLSPYSIPIAFFAMLLSILVSPKIAIFASVLLSLYVGSLTGFSFNYIAVFMLSGIVGAFSTRNIRRRNDLARAMLYVTISAIITIGAIRIINNQPVYSSELGAGIFSAILSFLLLVGILPIYESSLDICSDLTLLELTDLSHPLLVEMALKAPGTYQHSLTVGTLSEAGATAIGASTLLARVGAYYHDIGKINKPDYFVENQKYKSNPHDKMSPFMSAKVIISHVKDGVDLGRKYLLPQRIIDIIEQHHGDMTLTQFYSRALEEPRK
ncbi:MAG TPA: HDIG domain-containing protein, partial [Firmicutes bacterium]|nr:HDIG domain-containing protein [Bacillota bacterium]